MKNVLYIFVILGLITIASCDKTDRCSELVCVGDCLLVEMDRTATVHFYGCYDVWGIQFTSIDNEQVIGLTDDLPSEYQVENMEINFSATFYENDFPLVFPDPMPGRFYSMDLCDMLNEG